MLSNPFTRLSDFATLVLRVAIGSTFIYHGTMKWGMWSTPLDPSAGVMPMIMRLLSICEPIGGLALILGFLTPWAALGLAIVMVGAIWTKVSGGAEFGKWEFDLALLGGNLVIMTRGAGAWAIDRLMGKA